MCTRVYMCLSVSATMFKEIRGQLVDSPLENLRLGDWIQIFRFGGERLSSTESWPRCFFYNGPFTMDPRKAMKGLQQVRGTNTFAFPWLFVQIILREGLRVGGEKHKGRIPSNSPLANYFSFNALCTPICKNKSLLRFCGFCLATKQSVPNCLALYIF